MKKTLLIVATILAPLALQAKPGEGKGPKGGRPAPTAEEIAKFDTDGDGELSKEERKAAGEARKAEMLAKFDTDKDGKLSKEERQAAKIARFDTDGDGVLSETEEAAAKAAMESRRGGKGKGKGKGKDGPKPPKAPEEAPAL